MKFKATFSGLVLLCIAQADQHNERKPVAGALGGVDAGRHANREKL
ncbi:MAG: hypothetical protein ACREEM_09220 [Blastocatellia bacterium]